METAALLHLPLLMDCQISLRAVMTAFS